MRGYSPNWSKVRNVIRRLAGWRCERCGARHKCKAPGRLQRIALSVHHIGVPFADGRPGDPADKYDVRRENLIALCQWCHALADLAYSRACQIAATARKRHVRLFGPIVLLLPAPTMTRSERHAA